MKKKWFSRDSRWRTYSPATWVSVVVWNYGSVDAVRATLESVTCVDTWLNKELIVVDGGPVEPRKESYYASLIYSGAAVVIREFDEPNLAKLCALGADAGDGEALLFLRAGILVNSDQALETLLLRGDPFPGWAVTSIPEGEKTAYYKDCPLPESVLLLSMDTYFAAGGFDESFSQRGFGGALCVTLLESGRGCLTTADGLFRHGSLSTLPQLTKENRQRLYDRFRKGCPPEETAR